MPFLANEKPPIPTKDIISWYFDDPKYDLDKPIYIDSANPSRSYSHRQAKSAILRIAAGLKALGLKKDDCVCIHSFNDVNYPIVANGIVAASCIFSGTNPSYTPYELSHAVKTAKIALFIVEPELLPNVLQAAAENGISKDRILIFDNGLPGQTVPASFKSWRTLLNHGEAKDWERFDDLETSKTRVCARLFSSGTTGLPKAAMLTHYNWIAQHYFSEEAWPRTYGEVRQLLPLPFFHVAVAPRTIFSPLRSGNKTYTMRRFELEPFLERLQSLKITDLAMVPPVVIAIIMSPISKNYDLSSIKYGIIGAAPLSKETQARLNNLLGPQAFVNQVWGMTETTCIATCFRPDERDYTGSVGRVCPGLDVKLVDEEGHDVSGDDVRGEMCIRGPTVIPGYLDNPEANKSWDSDGFFHTGDIMYRDGKTKLWYHVDRKKELIKVRGFQVAPPEIEAVLLGHPQIIDAAVIGVRAPEAGSELPRAYIVKRPGPEGDKLTDADVHAVVNAKLAKYKQLTGGIKFVDAIPKTASGKILKRFLREQAERELGAKL